MVTMKNISATQMQELLEDKLRAYFGVTGREASDTQVFCACAMAVRESMSRESAAEHHEQERQVHYMSMEFLLGRSLEKNAYNLGVLDPLRQALESMGREPSEIFECEPDAGLGNGGLGRLAACFMDSCATLGLPVTGYSICYENGMFRQKIEYGGQRELADEWLAVGGSWLVPRYEDAVEVRFGGRVEPSWDCRGNYRAELKDYQSVIALPRDMLISGYDGGRINRLRLWEARSPSQLDMFLFSSGKYVESMQSRTLAEVITKVLYPADDHIEGKKLRLKQQYFFVSATAQSIVRDYRKRYGTVTGFEGKNVIQINDTHPALVIPELMRIFMDEDGLGWDEAWDIVSASTAYTNHTIMQEALEAWPQGLVQQLMPRVWDIIVEIDRRWRLWLMREKDGVEEKILPNLVINSGMVYMANICQAVCFRINGVSVLHGSILKKKLFRDVYEKRPERYTFITNGIDHRRWLSQCNSELSGLISSLIGDGWLRQAQQLGQLRRFENDGSVLDALRMVKQRCKDSFADWVLRQGGPALDTQAVLDVHVKRLHEYKRQLLCAMLITHLQHRIHDDPDAPFLPRTFVFAGKAAPGYTVAKRIIQLINSLSRDVAGDRLCRGRLQVAFLENYRVTMAEKLMPAAQVSEQISCAGMEASGTDNMKLMMNGTVTIGTLDGANVEMYSLLGDENMFLFGLRAEDIAALRREDYTPRPSEAAGRVLDRFSHGFSDGESYSDLVSGLLYGGDQYMLLADFDSYVAAHDDLYACLSNERESARMSLVNIAESGVFASDRACAQYAREIWRV